jgi:peptidylprolyl isomerase
MYESRGEMPVIQSVRLESDLPEAERSRLEVLRDDSASFKALAEARRNNPDPFIVNPAKRIELCNVPIPVRKIGSK